MSVRSSSPRQARAPRSTGWIPASAPPRLPTAVRTASMTYASVITAPLPLPVSGTPTASSSTRGISDSLFGDPAKHDG
ncbi:Uncharacterised protein [Mycobacterium tuberculosis]|nr:Uncharacterised protein [Mycobacterium tuberculosis]